MFWRVKSKDFYNVLSRNTIDQITWQQYPSGQDNISILDRALSIKTSPQKFALEYGAYKEDNT